MRIEMFYGLFGLSMIANAYLAAELVDGFVQAEAAEEIASYADRDTGVEMSALEPQGSDEAAIDPRRHVEFAFAYDRHDL